ncbi:nucleoid-associated protein [Aliamphritea hakodatensis]|uniref:nucleoid-associated protein n=1 Tax=Aliamphritea hakodatensis TaxID=2895352 RepID=UPI0022FD7B8C|nr:nucleoid-associated protein [Aliamphritea hakodatensis]
MELKHLAIRELLKNADETQATISNRGGPVDIQAPMAQRLFDTLVSAYGRRAALTHGSFTVEDPDSHPFIINFRQFISGTPDDSDFLSLCDVAMEQLAASLSSESASAATGGYVICCHYSADVFDYLLVALVRDKNGVAFDGNLHPTQVIELDLDKLHQAAKINISTYKEGTDSYLSFIGTKRKGDITHYFSTALGCSDVVPARQATSELIRATEDFCRKNQLQDKQEAIVDDVVGYLSKQRSEKQSAYLPDMDEIFAQHIPPEQAESGTESFGSFANSEEYQVSHEFQPHTSTINNYTKIKAKADNWQLDFSKRSLGELNSTSDIQFDPNTNSLIIRRLPTKVVDQLREALDD